MQHRSLISVIIPVYNGECYVAEAIDSVLNQTYKNIELIVIDDGSTDGTAAIVKNYENIIYFYQENRGLGAARNQGVDLAKGEYLAFLDADDYWLPEKLEQQLAQLSKATTLSLAFCYMEQFVCPKLSLVDAANIKLTHKILPGYSGCAILLSRRVFLLVGKFIETREVGEFVEWFGRAQDKKINVVMLPDILVMRRLHNNNMGRQKEKYSPQGYLSILKSTLERRRREHAE